MRSGSESGQKLGRIIWVRGGLVASGKNDFHPLGKEEGRNLGTVVVVVVKAFVEVELSVSVEGDEGTQQAGWA